MQRNCFALFIIDHFRLWHMTSYLLTGHPEIAVSDVRSVIVAGWIASIQSSWKLQSESAFENLFDLSLVDEIDIMRRERKPFKHIDNWILSTKTDERNIIAFIVLIDTHTQWIHDELIHAIDRGKVVDRKPNWIADIQNLTLFTRFRLLSFLFHFFIFLHSVNWQSKKANEKNVRMENVIVIRQW